MNAGPETGRTGRGRLLQFGPLLAIGVLCLALALGGDEARQWGRYEREGLEAGQWWRLATAHLVHLGWGHLALNLVGLSLLAALLRDALTAGQWLAAALVGALGINLGLYLLAAHIHWYVGLSGVLHTMLAWGAVRLIEERSPAGGILAVALTAKLVWEQWGGAVPLSGAAAGPVIVEAHLYGAVSGVLAAGISGLLVRRSRSSH